MTQRGLGHEVARGLLAGPADFQRLRDSSRSGLMARLWRRFEESTATYKKGSEFSGSLADLALLAAVTRRQDLAGHAIEAALEIAHRPHWVHFDAGCMSLQGMHAAHELCAVVDWLWPVLNRDQREALLGAVIAKAVENLQRAPDGVRDEGDGRGQLLFVRRLDTNDRHCLHPKAEQVNNWDLWFAGGLYQAAALAERAWLKPDPAWPRLEWGHYYPVGYELDAARISRWKGIAVERIRTALATQLGPDGDYAEGISYADYGGRALLVALTAVARAGGPDLFPPGLAALPRWLRNQFVADVPFGAANFNDSVLAAGLPAPLLAHVARRTRDPELQGYALEAVELATGNPGHLTLLGLDADLPGTPVALQTTAVYQHSGTVVWRTAQDRSGVFFAIKSGAYGGAHQHRDRNSIYLAAYGEHLVVDTGDSRYANPASVPNFAETRAHNCVLVDSHDQIGGNDRPTHGRIVEHRDADGLSTALADASGCCEGVESNRRRVVFLRPDLLVMADRVAGACRELTWLLQGNNRDGRAEWLCSGRHLVLKRPLAQLHVFLAEPVTRVSIGAGTMDNTQQAILRLEAVIPGKAVTAALVPVRAGEDAPACEWAADSSLTVRFGGQTHRVVPKAAAVTVNGREYGV